MTNDEYEELKMDRVQEHQQELFYEKRMYSDECYAVDILLTDIATALAEARQSLLNYGHLISDDDLCDQLKEMM